MRRTPSICNMQAPPISPRRSTSFSVISSEEHSELDWFDAEGMRSPMVAPSAFSDSSESYITMHCHAIMCGCPASKMVAFFDERFLQVQQELAQAKERIAQLEQQLGRQEGTLSTVVLLIQDICVVGMIFQFELTLNLLGTN